MQQRQSRRFWQSACRKHARFMSQQGGLLQNPRVMINARAVNLLIADGKETITLDQKEGQRLRIRGPQFNAPGPSRFEMGSSIACSLEPEIEVMHCLQELDIGLEVRGHKE